MKVFSDSIATITVGLIVVLSITVGLIVVLSITVGLTVALSITVGLIVVLSITVGLIVDLSITVGLIVVLSITVGLIVVLSLLDLAAAFDTVDHNILRRRLEATYDFYGAMLPTVASIDDRTQSVPLNCRT